MSELTAKEQQRVRAALRVLRVSIGTWKPLASALHMEAESLGKVVTGRRSATAGLALRVARFVDIPVDDLLTGKYLPARACPNCGHLPNEFEDDEATVVGDRQRQDPQARG